jgi:hypothetical protein
MLDAASVTATVATVGGGGVGLPTVMAIVPLTPSLVAVIVAEPAPAAVTTPLGDTVATLRFEDDHPIVRLSVGSTLPDASRSTTTTFAV